MAHRGRKRRSSFFLMKIRGRKKSASSAAGVDVVAGVKDAEAGGEVAGLVDEGMVAPIVIRLLMVDGAVVVVEDVGITRTTTIVPTKGIITMSVVTLGGVDLAVQNREAITTGVIPMATNNNLLTIAVAGGTTTNTEGTTTITTINTAEIVKETTNATISLRRMTTSTSSVATV